MGRVIVQFELMNYYDVQQASRGLLAADKVRKLTMQGVVDTGATRLVLPGGVAEQLGLPSAGRTSVRFADHRSEERDVVSDAFVQLQGRGGPFKAVIEPGRSDALLGAIVMEDLDFVLDCTGHRLVPRDPNMLLTEVE